MIQNYRKIQGYTIVLLSEICNYSHGCVIAKDSHGERTIAGSGRFLTSQRGKGVESCFRLVGHIGGGADCKTKMSRSTFQALIRQF